MITHLVLSLILDTMQQLVITALLFKHIQHTSIFLHLCCQQFSSNHLHLLLVLLQLPSDYSPYFHLLAPHDSFNNKSLAIRHYRHLLFFFFLYSLNIPNLHIFSSFLGLKFWFTNTAQHYCYPSSFQWLLIFQITLYIFPALFNIYIIIKFIGVTLVNQIHWYFISFNLYFCHHHVHIFFFFYFLFSLLHWVCELSGQPFLPFY